MIFLLKSEKLLYIKPYKVSDFWHVDSKNSNAIKIKNKDKNDILYFEVFKQ